MADMFDDVQHVCNNSLGNWLHVRQSITIEILVYHHERCNERVYHLVFLRSMYSNKLCSVLWKSTLSWVVTYDSVAYIFNFECSQPQIFFGVQSLCRRTRQMAMARFHRCLCLESCRQGPKKQTAPVIKGATFLIPSSFLRFLACVTAACLPKGASSSVDISRLPAYTRERCND